MCSKIMPCVDFKVDACPRCWNNLSGPLFLDSLFVYYIEMVHISENIRFNDLSIKPVEQVWKYTSNSSNISTES